MGEKNKIIDTIIARMDAKIFLPLPNLLSMFHPFLPPHRLPEGTIHGSAWMLEETHPSSTRTQILDRETDSRGLKRQTNRKVE